MVSAQGYTGVAALYADLAQGVERCPNLAGRRMFPEI